MLAAFWEKNVSKRKCPFSDVFNITMNPVNSSSALVFDRIPRLPQGVYRIDNRFHTKGNESIWGYEIKFTIRSKSGVDRMSMLEMG